MSADEHLHPGQLRMFMTPRDMMEGAVTHANDFPVRAGAGETNMTDRLIREHPGWKMKQRVAEREGLIESVAKEGVHEPLQIFHDNPAANAARGFGRDETRGMLRNGHHRFLAQYLADPDRYMPVYHRDING